jgi:hypothetical protein
VQTPSSGQIPQVDGAFDSDDENPLNANASSFSVEHGQCSDASMEVNATVMETRDNINAEKNTGALDDARRRTKCKDFEHVVKTSGVGTYKPVKLVPRPWRTPEGTVNHVTLKTMLRGVMTYIMEMPGITRTLLIQKYATVLQPVPLFELLEMLEEIGCVYHKYITRSHKPSLFSSRSIITEVADDVGHEIEVFFPTVDCILKLGQFIGQLQSGLRTSNVP